MDPTGNPVPALVFIGLYCLHIVVHALLHGQAGPRYDVGRALAGTVIGLGLLTWGGFFRVLGWHF